MASITLDLGRLLLTDIADKLKLTAVFAGSFQVPYSISTLNHLDILQAFESGHIYTSRGIGCSLDIRIFLEGKPLDIAMRDVLLDKLSEHLLDSKIWPRLGLLVSVNSDAVPCFELDISISLRHGQSKSTQKAGPRTRLLEKTDLTPPKDVCRAELKSIRLELDFTSIPQPQQPQKEIRKPSQNDSEIRLPDQTSQHLEDLESTVERIRSLPLMVSMNFEREGQTMPRHATTITKEDTKGSEDSPREPAPTSNPEAIQPAPKSKSFFFPEKTTQTLRAWLISHADNPFPTASEKQQLMKLTGLNKVQIKGWLHRNRKRANALAAQQDEKEMLFSEVVEGDHDEDIDLLSQTCDGELSQISEVSENSTSLLSEFSRATTVEETQVYRRGLEISAVTGLIDGALQIFIGGHYRRIVLPPGVKLVKPAPKICLSKLVPNLFNPGYREIMAYNFQFGPGIVRFTANPLPEHLQPDFLKEKMAQLAAMPISPISGYEVHDSTDVIDHRTRVVETRIFTMMQRTLYDPAATRKVWKKDKNEITEEAPEYEDLDPGLLDQGDDDASNTEWDDLLARFTSDEEFNDLLFDEDEDDDDDLLDEAERERLEVEREVDEMLFGDGHAEEDEEDDQYLLCGGESDDERSMLV